MNWKKSIQHSNYFLKFWSIKSLWKIITNDKIVKIMMKSLHQLALNSILISLLSWIQIQEGFLFIFSSQKTEILLKPINRLLVIIAVTASLILSQTFIWSGKKIVWKRLPNESRRRRYIRTIYWYIYISDFFPTKKNNELAFSLIASSKYYFWLFSYIFPTYRFFN